MSIHCVKAPIDDYQSVSYLLVALLQEGKLKITHTRHTRSHVHWDVDTGNAQHEFAYKQAFEQVMGLAAMDRCTDSELRVAINDFADQYARLNL